MNSSSLGHVTDLSFVINEKIGQLRDDLDCQADNIEQWLNNIFHQKEIESKTKKERCEICASKEEQTELELHHVAGKKHDFRTITTCKRCHMELSDNQKIWDKRWLSSDTTENLRKGFFLLGLYDILVLKAKYSRNSNYESLARKYLETISVIFKDN